MNEAPITTTKKNISSLMSPPLLLGAERERREGEG